MDVTTMSDLALNLYLVGLLAAGAVSLWATVTMINWMTD